MSSAIAYDFDGSPEAGESIDIASEGDGHRLVLPEFDVYLMLVLPE